MVCTIDPPVASIGSSTYTRRPCSDSGSDSMYGVGSRVSSSRARPTKPICDSGMSECAWSAIPSPARSTGTSSGGFTRRIAVVRATGVWIGTRSTGRSRDAS